MVLGLKFKPRHLLVQGTGDAFELLAGGSYALHAACHLGSSLMDAGDVAVNVAADRALRFIAS